MYTVSSTTRDVVLHDNGHQVPSNVASPPLSTTRAMALRTLSFHDDRLMIPVLSAYCGDDGLKPSDRRSSSITSTRYTLPNCSRGTHIDGRRSTRTAGRQSAASRSETDTIRASCDSDSAFCSASRRIRALHSPYPLDRVLGFGRGNEGWFARM